MKYPGKRILCDADGVLLDFVGPIVTWINNSKGYAHAGKAKSVEQITDWDIFKALGVKHLQAEGFSQINARDLPVYPRAVEFYDALCALADVEIVTSPFVFSPTWESDRRWSLDHHFGHKAKHVHFTEKKHMFKGDVLIDDGPHNINDFPGPVVIVDRPWNQNIATSTFPRYRCLNYPDALACVDRVLKGTYPS